MMTKVLMIATDWNDGKRDGKLGGVSHYRLQLPKQHLEQHGYEVDVYGKEFSDKVLEGGASTPTEIMQAYQSFVAHYDIVISKVVDNKIAAMALRRACHEAGVPLVVDIDDNFMEIRPDQPAYTKGYHPGGEKRAIAAAFVSVADALFCSTQPLADYLRKMLHEQWKVDIPIFVLPNSFDITEWKPHTKIDNVIGWAGSITHDADIAIALPALMNAIKDRPEYRIEFVGGFHREGFEDRFTGLPKWFTDKIDFVHGTRGYDGYPELMSERTWKLGIAPLVSDEFNAARSQIKWCEYALAGIPCVASDWHPYEQIKHGVTGFLTKDNNWITTIETALESDLDTITKNAQAYIKEYMDINMTGKLWDQAIQDIVV